MGRHVFDNVAFVVHEINDASDYIRWRGEEMQFMNDMATAGIQDSYPE